MAFNHGKNCRVWIDGYDLSQYFTEASMSGKVDLADTTTFAGTAGALVAKTVIPGITDGTISLKGMFDGSPAQIGNTVAASKQVVGVDNYFNNLIVLDTGSGTAVVPQNIDTCCTVSPTGATSAGSRVWCCAGALSSYQFTAPIKNVVTVDAQIQSDGGLDTGVSLYDPTTPDTPNATPATVSNGASLTGGTLTAATGNPSTTYPGTGKIAVPVTGGFQILAYTGTTATTWTGVTGGSGTSSGGSVLQVFSGTGVNDTQSPQGSATTDAFTGAIVLSDGGFLTVNTSPAAAGFPARGQLVVPITPSGTANVYYTGLTYVSPFKFTGLSNTGGATTTTGGSVTLAPVTSHTGAYALLHVGAVGTGGIAYAAVQSSDDNATWTTTATWTLSASGAGLSEVGTGQLGGTGGTGGYILTIPPGTAIGRFVRVLVAYTAGSTGIPILVSFVRL